VLGAVTSPAGTYNAVAYAIICCAGPLAEERFTGIDLDDQPGAYTDLLMARNALAKLDVGPPLDTQSVLPFTRLLVEHNWPTTQLLATQLVLIESSITKRLSSSSGNFRNRF
jgi:hypothetical protein